MLDILATLTPVFLVIVAGYLLYRFRLMDEPVWAGVEQLCYYLLLPALIVKELATADVSALSLAGLVGGFLLALLVASSLLLATKPALTRLMGLSDAGFTSVFQGSTRWHGFIALATVAALFGTKAVTVVAVGLAVLVPALNLINVLVLLRWGERDEDIRPRVMSQIVRNPFIIACGAGILLNLTGLGLPEPLHTAFVHVGNGALGVSLLTIGAGLRPIAAFTDVGPIVFGILFRLCLMPVIFFFCLTVFGVTGDVRTYAVICGAVPTAASAYVLARKMGGDAPLMASMITAQVLAAAVTLPITIYVLRGLE